MLSLALRELWKVGRLGLGPLPALVHRMDHATIPIIVKDLAAFRWEQYVDPSSNKTYSEQRDSHIPEY